MLPYYSPNLSIKRMILSFFQFNSEKRCIDFYKRYSNKKYILMTSSCRSALFLAYSALNKRGKVIISPLICTTALEPILAAKNEILFSDISEYDMNLDVGKLPLSLPKDTIAIQTTYFGGQPLDLDSMISYAKQHNLILIEDCAQGFGSLYKNRNIGTFGDISCFSMVKTAYGISGGVLATNDEHVFQRARDIQETFKSGSLKVEYYRLLRNCIETYRMSQIGTILYNMLLGLRPQKSIEAKCFNSFLIKPSNLCQKVFITQLAKHTELHQKRLHTAKKYCELLSTWYDGVNFHFDSSNRCLPTKLFFYKKNFNSKKDIEELNIKGIEAKHLQQKYGCFYQDSLNHPIYQNDSLLSCDVFMRMHDKIVTFPLLEDFKDGWFKRIENIL